MLYNKRWDKQTIANPFTLESLIGWLKKMPANESYSFLDCKGECLIGQYMTNLGLSWEKDYDYCDICEKIFDDQTAAMAVLAVHPQTFGAALERAKLGNLT
jgi:hypothetical protein